MTDRPLSPDDARRDPEGFARLVEAARAADAGAPDRAFAAIAEAARSPVPRIAATARTLEGRLHLAAGDTFAAATAFQAALVHDPDLPEPHERLGEMWLHAPALMERACAHFWAASRLQPDRIEHVVRASYLHRSLALWRDFDRLEAIELAALDADPASMLPFHSLFTDATPDRLLACARARTAPMVRPPVTAHRRKPADAPLRVGYISGDFGDHPVGFLAVRLIEAHDRDRVELRGYATRPDDGSPVAKRYRAALPMADLEGLDTAAAVARILADDLDVLVDLNGHTAGVRHDVLAARPAPVQATWLGYPGTTGAPWFDYAVVDPVVAPPGADRWFSETLIRIGCYQPNDGPVPVPDDVARGGPGRAAARRAHGLPADAAVFCSFNHWLKITPTQFDVWLRVLRAVPGSVQWLMAPYTDAGRESVRERAAAGGVDPDRIVFAPKADHADHLQRLALADVVLDTRPYGAHTTASDALRVGVPVLTVPGPWFQGRVAASLLVSVGLPDLVLPDDDTLVAEAVDLANAPGRRALIRAHLRGEGLRSRMMDAPAGARELEAAYAHMATLWRTGRPPRALSVA